MAKTNTTETATGPVKSDGPAETRLDSHNDAPSTTAVGDGPADTTDPNERASTVLPNTTEAAKAGYQTVNSAVPLPDPPAVERDSSNDRYEEYDATRPDGTTVHVRRNLDTGAQTVTSK